MSVESLAQALLGAGILDAASVEMRMSRARSARALVEGIIADGLVTENSLVSQFARALGLPRYDPSQRRPEPEALALIDWRRIQEWEALPVALRGGGGLLWVAMCDPTDEPTLAEIASSVGRRVKPCVIGPREFERALKELTATPREPQRTEAFPTAVGAAAGTVVTPNAEPMISPPRSHIPPYAAGVTQRMVPPEDSPLRRPVHPSPQGTPLPNSASSEQAIQKLEETLEQTRQVVKILAQMLVEQGIVDGDELKRRLRAEQKRK